MIHPCLVCSSYYECPWCSTDLSFICPTTNCDEDANMCDACVNKAAIEQELYMNSLKRQWQAEALEESLKQQETKDV